MKRRGFTRRVAQKIQMLTQLHKVNRVNWAKANRSRVWKGVTFSDEMSIWLAGDKVCPWYKRGTKAVKPNVKHCLKLHVWEAFSARGKFPIKCSEKISPDKWHKVEPL